MKAIARCKNVKVACVKALVSAKMVARHEVTTRCKGSTCKRNNKCEGNNKVQM